MRKKDYPYLWILGYVALSLVIGALTIVGGTIKSIGNINVKVLYWFMSAELSLLPIFVPLIYKNFSRSERCAPILTYLYVIFSFVTSLVLGSMFSVDFIDNFYNLEIYQSAVILSGYAIVIVPIVIILIIFAIWFLKDECRYVKNNSNVLAFRNV
jgi:hypothetical protein